MPWVITHPAQGLFIGVSQGFPPMTMWSKIDNAGEDRCSVFHTRELAVAFTSGFAEPFRSEPYGYHEVEVSPDDSWAHVSHLRAAGLEEHLGLMAWGEMMTVSEVGSA